MKRVSAIVLVVVFAALSSATRLAAQVPANLKNPKVAVYDTNGDGGYRATQKYAGVRAVMLKLHVLEKYSQFLAPIRFPYTLRLWASENDEEDNCTFAGSPHYSPGGRWINMCYQFADEMLGIADDVSKALKTRTLAGFPPASREQIIMGLYAAVLMHETGHAMFDLLSIPVFGREEDAADQMAAFVAVNLNKDMARTIILGFAYFWLAAGNPPDQPPTSVFRTDPKTTDGDMHKCLSDPICSYADEHGTGWQRMYNVLCIAYGSDHATFQDLVDAGWLPKERAAACDGEYKQVYAAFRETALPFIDLSLVDEVRKVKWFDPADLR